MTLYLDSTINFGKYAGKQLKDIPDNYIQWLKDNTEHTIKNRFKPKDQTPEKVQSNFFDMVKLENFYRVTCAKIGRQLIYENVQIPF